MFWNLTKNTSNLTKKLPKIHEKCSEIRLKIKQILTIFQQKTSKILEYYFWIICFGIIPKSVRMRWNKLPSRCGWVRIYRFVGDRATEWAADACKHPPDGRASTRCAPTDGSSNCGRRKGRRPLRHPPSSRAPTLPEEIWPLGSRGRPHPHSQFCSIRRKLPRRQHYHSARRMN